MKNIFPLSKKNILFLVFSSFILGAFFSFKIAKATFSDEVIQNAATVAGIEFDKKEMQLMREDLTGQVESYQKIWDENISNDVVPSMMFNPLPQGFEWEKTQRKIHFSDYSKTQMPKDMEDLAFYSIGQLAHLIKTQQITSVELTKFFLKRLKKFDKQLHCVITFTDELALEQAARVDAEIKAGRYRGLLHGIPYGAKDLLATKNYKTTWGATPFQNQMIDVDATVIRKLEDAGALLPQFRQDWFPLRLGRRP